MNSQTNFYSQQYIINFSKISAFLVLERRHCLFSGSTVKINNKGKSVGVRENLGPKFGMPAFDRNKKTQQAS